MLSFRVCKHCLYKRWLRKDLPLSSRKGLMQQFKYNWRKGTFYCPFLPTGEKKRTVNIDQGIHGKCVYTLEQIVDGQEFIGEA